MWAALLNTRADDGEPMAEDLDESLARAFSSVVNWPAADAFPARHDSGPIDGCFGRSSFIAGRLCLPVLDIPGLGRYTATFQLTDFERATFSLTTAMPALDNSDEVARFDAARGLVSVPHLLLPVPGNAPAAFQITLEPAAGPGLQLRLRDVVPR